jgi:hypothetical protein
VAASEEAQVEAAAEEASEEAADGVSVEEKENSAESCVLLQAEEWTAEEEQSTEAACCRWCPRLGWQPCPRASVDVSCMDLGEASQASAMAECP